MIVKYKNVLMEKIKEAGSLTDKTLVKDLKKDGYDMSESLFNKTLLDIEIMGLVKVNWLTKDTRRIEIVSEQHDENDEIEIQNKETLEKDYEDSFPEYDGNN